MDIAISTEALDECDKLTKLHCYSWHHVLVVPENHALLTQTLSLAKIAQYPILTYMPGMTGQGKIMQAFASQGLNIEVDLYATDSDVIKNYVRLGFGVGIIAEMAFDPAQDQGLVKLDLSSWLTESTKK